MARVMRCSNSRRTSCDWTRSSAPLRSVTSWPQRLVGVAQGPVALLDAGEQLVDGLGQLPGFVASQRGHAQGVVLVLRDEPGDFGQGENGCEMGRCSREESPRATRTEPSRTTAAITAKRRNSAYIPPRPVCR